MIDPVIASGGRNPLDAMSQSMQIQQQQDYSNANLKSIGQQQTLNSQHIQANDIALKTQAALNDAVKQSTSTDDKGNLSIDHDSVARLMAKNGYGAAGEDYRDTQKKADLAIQGMTSEQALRGVQIQRVIADRLSAVRDIKDPQQRQDAWNQTRNEMIQTFKADPNSIKPQAPDDATLEGMETAALDAQGRIAKKHQETLEAIANKRADADEKRAQGTYEWMTRRGLNETVIGTTKEGYPVFYDPESKSTRIDKTTPLQLKGEVGLEERIRHDQAMEGVAAQNANTNSRRADQADTRIGQSDQREDRANETQIKSIEAREGTLNTLRTRLGEALKGGYYIDNKGNRKDYDNTDAEVEDMQGRIAAAGDELKKLVDLKNQTMARRGQTPRVSSDQAAQAFDSQQGSGGKANNPKAASQQQPQPGQNSGSDSALPKGSGGDPDPVTAMQFYRAANGDKAKARQMAIQYGWNPKQKK